MKPPMKPHLSMIAPHPGPLPASGEREGPAQREGEGPPQTLGRGFLRDTAGAVAAELAIAVPFLVWLIAGVIDFSGYMNSSQAITAATRIGAEFARDSATCKSGIQVLPSMSISSACIGQTGNSASGIEGAIQKAAAFTTADLSFPNLSTCNATPSNCLVCYCESTATPATYTACNTSGGTFQSCFTNPPAGGYTGPNRIFMKVDAKLALSPIISWPGFPANLPGLTEIRLQ
jgi:Flp pilus assembly protein TadG